MDIQKDKDFTSLPEIAKLYQACKERDLTIAEREYLKGARDAWQAAKTQAVPEGFVLIKDDTKTVVAIERMVEQQVEASGMDSSRLERLDGWKIIEAAVKAQEQAND